MAKSILRTALRLKDTRDAILFGQTLSQEERSELRSLSDLLVFFKKYIVNGEVKNKLSFRIQFINDALGSSERELKEPYNKIEKGDVYV